MIFSTDTYDRTFDTLVHFISGDRIYSIIPKQIVQRSLAGQQDLHCNACLYTGPGYSVDILSGVLSHALFIDVTHSDKLSIKVACILGGHLVWSLISSPIHRCDPL